MATREEPLRVVVFTGGAVLESDCAELVRRIDADADLALVGVFCETDSAGLSGVVRDLFRRRTWLAPLLLLQRGLRRLGQALLAPGAAIARRRAMRRLAPLMHFVPDLHAPDVLSRIEALKPGLGAVYGGPILRQELFEIPTHGTIGIHHGLLPRYRGKKTTFWAIYNGEAEVGVAIQRIGKGLDRGDTLREATLPVGRKPLPVVRRQLERMGLDLYGEALLAVQRGKADFRPQAAGTGPLYRDPRAADIIRFWLRDIRRLLGVRRVRHPQEDDDASPAAAGERVCILTETFHPVTGGGETQARALAEGLRAAGVGVELVTRRTDAALPAQATVGGVPVHRVGPVGPGHFRKWGLVFTALVALVRLRRRYDVLLVCGYRVLGIPAMLVSLATGKPCVLKADSQGEMSGRFFDPGLARLKLRHDGFPVNVMIRLRNLLLRRARGFVAMSAVIEEELLAHGVPAERIARIPNSVDTERFRPVSEAEKRALRVRLGLPVDARVVTFTGRLVTTKGLPSLLRAWGAVTQEHLEAVLVLVGSGGLGLQNCEKELRSYAARHQLQDSVVFTGSVENVHEYLQASDLFVFPTEREAFGISVIEAMACGLPVVTTAVDGIRDIIHPGVDALVVPPAHDRALAAALVRGLDGGEDIEQMAASGSQITAERFSSHSVVAAYRELLLGLVKP